MVDRGEPIVCADQSANDIEVRVARERFVQSRLDGGGLGPDAIATSRLADQQAQHVIVTVKYTPSALDGVERVEKGGIAFREDVTHHLWDALTRLGGQQGQTFCEGESGVCFLDLTLIVSIIELDHPVVRAVPAHRAVLLADIERPFRGETAEEVECGLHHAQIFEAAAYGVGDAEARQAVERDRIDDGFAIFGQHIARRAELLSHTDASTQPEIGMRHNPIPGFAGRHA